MSTYTMTVTVDLPPAEADPRVREALKAEGFGILSEIDVQGALKEKIGEDVGVYTILGACNPPLAHRAVQADPDIGALLPCNVLLRANGTGTDVVAADPEAMMEMAGEGLAEVAADAKARLRRALDSLTG